MTINTTSNSNYQITSTDIVPSDTGFISREYLIDVIPSIPSNMIQTGLWAWGNNATTGENSSSNRSSPVQTIVGGENWKIVSQSKSDSAAAITKDGKLFIWGNNRSGKLGDNTITTKSSPIQLSGSWKDISTSYANAIGIKTDGTLWAWGSNSNGTLGDNTTVDKSSPVQVVSSGMWRSCSSGTLFSGAIKSDSSLWMWGQNTYGNLGEGTTVSRSSPVQTLAFGNNWKQLSCGDTHSAAIKEDGSLWLWGDNTYGQLGDGTKTNKSSPVQTISGGSWKQVSAGKFYTAAVKDDGTLWTWGNNSSGNLGTNNTISRSSPVQTIADGNNWYSVSTSINHTIAMKIDGSIWSWGNNTDGALGDGTTTNRSSPVQSIQRNRWVRISATEKGMIGIKDDTNLLPSYFSILSSDTSDLWARNDYFLDGEVWTWGQNNVGQLGNNTTTSKSSPVQIIDASPGWHKLSGSASGSVLGIKFGLLYAWGFGTQGQLGDGTLISKSSPVLIGGSQKWKSIGAGSSHSLAVRDDGILYTWGDNTYGQLGDNTTTSKSSPIQTIVGGNITWKSVVAGNTNSIGIKTDNSLWTWGRNNVGQLGDNTTTNRSSPVQISGSWRNAASYGNFVVAVKTDGSLWAWGENNVGQLGDGTTTNRSSPVQIGNETWSKAFTGFYSAAGIKTDGSLWLWGDNSSGTLGDNTTTNRSSPVQTIAGGYDWQSVNLNNKSVAAIKHDNTLWTWGNNTNGQLGDNTTTNKSSPVQTIIGGSNWKSIEAGANSFTSIREVTAAVSSALPPIREIIITDTSLTSIDIPGNFNPANNTIETWGAGADGGSVGGGGGAYSKTINASISPGSTLTLRVSSVGTSSSYVKLGSTSICEAQSASGQTGGQSLTGTGTVKYSGGNGNLGGGAAGSEDGNGGNGDSTKGGNTASGDLGGNTGSNGVNGTDAICNYTNGTSGSAGSIGISGTFNPSKFSGSGGGKGGNGGAGGVGRSCTFLYCVTIPPYTQNCTWRTTNLSSGSNGNGAQGGNGGGYGGGGGAYGTGASNGTQGLGAQGAIRIRWQPLF